MMYRIIYAIMLPASLTFMLRIEYYRSISTIMYFPHYNNFCVTLTSPNKSTQIESVNHGYKEG